MWGRFRAHLTDDAKYWYKLWSTWLAAIWGMAVYAIADDPSSIGQILNSIPEPYRHFVPGFMFIIAGPLPIVVRLWRQKPAPAPTCDDDGDDK